TMHISGKTNLIMQPEFDDVEKVRSFYELMDREDEIANLLKTHTEGIQVMIGSENEVDEIKDFSLITASYQLGNSQLGTIALLGTTRMEYMRVINLLHSLSSEMTETLNIWYKKKLLIWSYKNIWITVPLCWFSFVIHDIVLRGYCFGGGAKDGKKERS